MDPLPGYILQQLRNESEHYISLKVTRSREVSEEVLLHTVRELQNLHQASPQSPGKADVHRSVWPSTLCGVPFNEDYR